MTENRHKRQTVSLEGVDSGDAPVIVSRDCDYEGHKQLRIRFGHVPIRDLLDIEFRPMLRQNVAMAHVLGLACTKASMSCRKLRPSSTAVRCQSSRQSQAPRSRRNAVGASIFDLSSAPGALPCLRETKRCGGRSRRLRPHGSRGRSAPGKTRRYQSRTHYCRIRSSRPAPRSSLRALGPARVSSDFIPPTARACWGASRVGGAPSPAMPVAACDGGPSEGRGLQRLDARRLLVAHDEGAVA